MDLTSKVYTSFSGINAFDKIKVLDFFGQNDSRSNNENLDASISAALKTVPSFGGLIITLCNSEEIMAAAIINFTGMTPYFPFSFITHVAIAKNQENQQALTDLLIECINGQLQDNFGILLKTTHPLYKLLRASSMKEKGRFLSSN
jgi:ribosomal-protein-alanine N-acetyltransferase